MDNGTASDVLSEAKRMFHIEEVKSLLTPHNVSRLIISLISLIVFYSVYKMIKKALDSRATKKLDKNASFLISRAISYIFYVIMGMYILGLLGIDLSAVWGAAGIAGLAIGFAAQTTVSNMFSGIFVITEKAIKIGDYISVNDVSGTVDNIGLLSIRIHTADNQMIRIPASDIINNNLTNYSYFNIRRLVYEIRIPYETDPDYALDVIKSIPAQCNYVLKDPVPLVYFDGLDNGLMIKLCTWIESANLFDAKTEGYKNIVRICNEKNINIIATRVDVSLAEKK